MRVRIRFSALLVSGYAHLVFDLCVRLMEGGADSGFRHVEPEKYQSRLFHFCGTGKNVVMSQVSIITPGRIVP